MSKVSEIPAMWFLPASSRTFSPSMCSLKESGSARLPVMKSTSTPLHPAIAVSSSSTGVNVFSPSWLNTIFTPWRLTAS